MNSQKNQNNTPMDIIKKSDKGKCSAIKIDHNIQNLIKETKNLYREWLEENDRGLRPIDLISIYVILNELDEFDQNILISYYTIAEGSSKNLSTILGVESSVITSRIKKIQNYVRNKSMSIADDRGIHY